ncbi:Potassium-transporting ATPase KdpC subunit OS=Castellaniella defragrans OX=75697 GN=kdpC PE=3 SV=1 [Castellaniella defragrans]
MDTRERSSAGAVGPVFRGLLRPAATSAVFFMIVAGLAYPLLTTGLAQALFPDQARGSLIMREGRPVGSRLIGQDFKRAQYFQGRPSATQAADPAHPSETVEAPYNAAASGGGNQGALSKKLLQAVEGRVHAYRKENGLAQSAEVPVDAATASGSGLDPDISPANARLQASRVARARGWPEQKVLALVARNTVGRQFGFLGDPRVNVLELNLALDAAAAAEPAPHSEKVPSCCKRN